ncbi:MAG: hypothetical protein CMJ95_11515 [Planctomycetes bacterium]|nr:hypothetical protein [Planctomycetota bacterium]
MVASSSMTRLAHSICFVGSMAILCFIVGCQPSSRPELISARIEGFLDDGIGHDDQIVLVLDMPVSLNGNPRTGLIFSPTATAKAKSYSIQAGSARNILIVDIESGFEDLVARGNFEAGSSTSISLDLGLIGLATDDGKPLSGMIGPVDLEPPPPDPALLIVARWIDSDQSSTVNQEDLLLLQWDQPVQISDQLRARKLEISQALVRLSVEGDRLGSLNTPARFLDGPLSRETRILLGNHPLLTIDGIYDPGRSRYEGSPSGIAVGATTILPTTTLNTLQGAGVASPRVIDIEGECNPWQELPLPIQLPALEGHTLTHLPGGQVLLTGGRILRPGGGHRVVADAWILDPQGDHRGPIPMHAPRRGHTATLLPGEDGIHDTDDDLVILIGGWDGSQTRKDSEVMLLSSTTKEFVQLETGTPRFEHSAHPTGDGNSVILVGGRLDDKQLNGLIEQLDVRISKNDDGITFDVTRNALGQLKYPRHQHASILFEDSEQPLLFIYGGYGGSLGTPHVQLTGENCRILDEPEAFRIRTSAGYARPLLMPPGADLPGPRRGLHLFPLDDSTGQGNRALLVAGTRKEAILDAFSPVQITECRTAYTLYAEDPGGGRIRLDWTSAGRLPVEMFQPCIAAIPGGRILVAGGLEKEGRPTAEAAIYDPVSGILERVCRTMTDSLEDSRAPLASRAVSLWGGALILGASPENQTCQAILFRLGN